MNDGMPWRRLERVEPPEQRLMSFAARSLRDHLLRYPSDARGVLVPSTDRPVEDLLTILSVPSRERKAVGNAIRELLKDGNLIHLDRCLSIRNFHVSQSFVEQVEGHKSKEAERKAAWRAKQRSKSQQEQRDMSGTGTGHVPTGTCPGQNGTVPDVDQIREDQSSSGHGTRPTGHGTRDTGQDVQNRDTAPTPTPPAPSTTNPERPSDIRCPPDLRLTEEQIATLETAMIPRWAIDQLTASFVSSAMVDGRPRPLSAWLKCLSKAVSGNWNNAKTRPQQVQAQRQAPREGADWMAV
jgi:hypothetical protein